MSIFRKWHKPRFLLAYLLVPVLFLSARITDWRLGVGAAIAMLGLAVRFWANGYVGHVKVNWTQKERGDAKIGQWITGGPYAFVRHPLYLGSFLIGAGFCLIVGNVWLSLAALGFFLVVYRRKMVQEEALIADELGTPYIVYRSSVPQWLPTWRRYPNRQGRWSWRGVAASKEWKTQIWTVVTAIAFYLRAEVFEEHDLLGPHERTLHIILLFLVASLVAWDGLFELRKQVVRSAEHRTS